MHVKNICHKIDSGLLSSPPVFIGVRVARSFVLCVVFCRYVPFLRFTDSDLVIPYLVKLFFHQYYFCHQYIFSCYIIACSRGTYGLNCSETCSNCKYQYCSPVTGVCSRSGCKDGWQGAKCNQGIRFCILYINVIFSIPDKKKKKKEGKKNL